MTTLTATTLQISCTAESDITFGRHKAGNSLRNGMANNMLRMVCPEKHSKPAPKPEHWATCPACYLLAADTHQGRTTRRYAITPPVPDRIKYSRGQAFIFRLTLFGGAETIRYLPHFILAINETGRLGVGYKGGKFSIQTISAINPVTNQTEQIATANEQTVHIPQTHITWPDVIDSLPQKLAQLQESGKKGGNDQNLTLCFDSPLRIEESRQLIKAPDFSIFFKRLLWRIDELGKRYGSDEKRSKASIDELLDYARDVRLVELNTRWQELSSRSGRTGRNTPLSGLVGRATYTSKHWEQLLPYLVWGETIQVGKSVTKGNGAYRIHL